MIRQPTSRSNRGRDAAGELLLRHIQTLCAHRFARFLVRVEVDAHIAFLRIVEINEPVQIFVLSW
jgi:hypothetical protein